MFQKLKTALNKPALASVAYPLREMKKASLYVVGYPLELFNEGWNKKSDNKIARFFRGLYNLIEGDTKGWPCGVVGLATPLTMVFGAIVAGIYCSQVSLGTAVTVGVIAAAGIAAPFAFFGLAAGGAACACAVIKGPGAFIEGLKRARNPNAFSAPVVVPSDAPVGQKFSQWVVAQLEKCTTEQQVEELERLRKQFPDAFNVVSARVAAEQATARGALAKDIKKTKRIVLKS